MMEDRQFRLRVTYGKTGRLAMLSHLEVTHALERMVRRAGLPFALSNGFSPHMKMAFGSALPVGVGSTCEVFDLTLADYVSPAKALAALADASARDMMPTHAAYIEPSAKAASVAYPYSLYEASFDGPLGCIDVPAKIEVVRKKKTKTLAVCDYLVEGPVADGCELRFQLQARETGSLRPDVLLKALASGGDGAGARLPMLQSITRVAQSASRI